jgi:hypothetical protein
MVDAVLAFVLSQTGDAAVITPVLEGLAKAMEKGASNQGRTPQYQDGAHPSSACE